METAATETDRTSRKRGGGILRNVFTVGGFTALSRVLGLVREMLQSRFIGAGVEQSAFTLAFAIPNMARKLFGEGALTAAFVPIFREETERVGVEKAARLARAVLSMSFAMLGATVVLAWLGLGVRAAFSDAPSARTTLTCGLVATLLPYMLFICGAAFGMGVLNALGKFKAASLTPSLLNVFWILGLACLAFFPAWDAAQRIRFVAYAILLAGAVQMAFMFSRMRAVGVTPRLTRIGWGDAQTRRVWRNTAIGAMGAGAVQLNYMLDQILGQVAAPWAAGVIGYADRLMDLPLGVVAVAFGTVLLPTFSAKFAKGDVEGARAAFVSSTAHMLFLMVPAAAGLFILAHEATDVIYGGGAFGAAATVRVSRALAAYAVGLAFFGLQKTLVPWFQAQKDMRTPFRVTVGAVLLNATLNILAVTLLPVEWRHVGLAMSTTFCSGVGCVALAVLAVRRNGSLGLRRLARPVARILVATAAMSAALVALHGRFDALGGVGALAALVTCGAAAYFGTYALAGGILRLCARGTR